MTQEQAEKAANIVLGVAAVAAGYAIWRVPAVRRMVWQMAKTAVGAAGPWLVAEARRAWDRNGRHPVGTRHALTAVSWDGPTSLEPPPDAAAARRAI